MTVQSKIEISGNTRNVNYDTRNWLHFSQILDLMGYNILQLIVAKRLRSGGDFFKLLVVKNLKL